MSNNKPSLSDGELLRILALSHNATAIYTSKDLIIETANDAMLAFWNKDRTVIGMQLAQAVPALENNPLLIILKNVWLTKETFVGHEVPVEVTVNGTRQTVFFDFEYRAVKNDGGEMYAILHTAANVTESVKRNRIKVEYGEHRLGQMVTTSPVGMTILRSKELIVEVANAPMYNIWMRTSEQMLGNSLVKVFPELLDQPFPQMLYDIFDSGKALAMPEVEANVADANGNLKTYYLNFSYNPLFDPNGNVESVLATVIDITDGVLARKQIEQNEEALQTLNEELAAANEEFESLNEELATTNEELSTANEEFTVLNEELLATNEELAAANDEILKGKNTLSLAIDAAGLITWTAHLGTRAFKISDNGRAVLELGHIQNLTLDSFLNTFAFKHTNRINQAFEKAIAAKSRVNIEFSILANQGQKTKWFKLNALPYFNTEGIPTYLTGTLLDITEQKEDEQRKNDFIAMVSHELKTPLTSLKAYVQMLAAKSAENADLFFANALDKANIQVNKMTGLINGFLNLSRLESGKITLAKQNFDLETLIEENIAEMAATTNTHSIRFLQGSNLSVFADRDKIGSVINNLLSNAIKYSPRATVIEVQCLLDAEEMIRVTVTDHGIGINPQDVDRLFDRFYRVEAKETQTISGFGIGLYLSAEIVQRHDGRIWVESTPGNGSTFQFTLPAKLQLI